jgi:hypothetical protein
VIGPLVHHKCSTRGLTNSSERPPLQRAGSSAEFACLKSSKKSRRESLATTVDFLRRFLGPRERSDRGLTNSSERPPLKRGGSSAEFALAEALLRAEALQHKKKNQALISLDSHIVHWSFTHVQLWLQLHLNFVQVMHTYLLGYDMPLRLPREVNCQILLMNICWCHVIHIVS